MLDSPLARSTDPQTSHDAADRAHQFIASHDAKIYGVLCDHHPTALTYRAIAAFAKLEPVAVGRRLTYLERRGLIRPTGEVHEGCRLWAKA